MSSQYTSEALQTVIVKAFFKIITDAGFKVNPTLEDEDGKSLLLKALKKTLSNGSVTGESTDLSIEVVADGIQISAGDGQPVLIPFASENKAGIISPQKFQDYQTLSNDPGAWHIRLDGNDMIADGSLAKPFLTAQAALDKMSQDDIKALIFGQGTFPSSINFNKSGVTCVLSDYCVVGSASATLTYDAGVKNIRWVGGGRLYMDITDTSQGNINYKYVNLTKSKMLVTSKGYREIRSIDGDNFDITVDHPEAIISLGYLKSLGNTVIKQGLLSVKGTLVNTGYFTHIGGTLIIDDISGIIANEDGNAVISTAPKTVGNLLVLCSGINLIKPDGSLAKINKTGLCDYILKDFIRDIISDTLNGTQLYPGFINYEALNGFNTVSLLDARGYTVIEFTNNGSVSQTTFNQDIICGNKIQISDDGAFIFINNKTVKYFEAGSDSDSIDGQTAASKLFVQEYVQNAIADLSKKLNK